MAIRKNRRMQKGGGMFDWVFNMFGSNKDQVQVPTGQGQVPTEQGQVPTEQGQVPTGQGQVPTGQGQVHVGQGRAPAEPDRPSSMGGKFRGGKSNRRSKSKKSRRTRRR